MVSISFVSLLFLSFQYLPFFNILQVFYCKIRINFSSAFNLSGIWCNVYLFGVMFSLFQQIFGVLFKVFRHVFSVILEVVGRFSV